MRQITKVEVATLKPHPKWLREGKTDPAAIAAMLESLVAQGQLIPLIIFCNWIIDGNCRVQAMLLGEITDADAIVLDHEPSELEVLEIQLAIDVHRSSVATTQRAKALAAIQKAAGYSVTELAKREGMKQPMCSQLLLIDKASPEIKAMLDEGKIDIDKAAMLCRCLDPAVIQQAPTLSRDQLRRKVNGMGKPEVKASSVSLALAGQFTVIVKGQLNDMRTLVEVLQETMKQARQAMSKDHTLSSVAAYFKRSLGGNDNNKKKEE